MGHQFKVAKCDSYTCLCGMSLDTWNTHTPGRARARPCRMTLQRAHGRKHKDDGLRLSSKCRLLPCLECSTSSSGCPRSGILGAHTPSATRHTPPPAGRPVAVRPGNGNIIPETLAALHNVLPQVPGPDDDESVKQCE